MHTPLSSLEFDPERLEFHAACPAGLDEFLEDEIKSFRLKIVSKNRSGAYFRGKNENILEFILSTKFSSKVGFIFKKLNVDGPDSLYQEALKLPWEHLLKSSTSFKIDSYTKDNLKDSRYALYRLKDAIKDRVRDKKNYELIVARDNPDILIILRSMGEMASIEISLSGRPLQKRGYREESVPAPIRENLAQALIYFSGWDRRSPLIDPMCGAGTILIEAALIIKNKNWINYDSLKKSYIFEMVFREVKSPHRIADQLLKKKEIPILGYDSDPFALELARKNAEKAGVEDMIQFEAIEIQDFKNIHSYKNGFIITNPPYGERMGEKEEVKELYEKFGKSLKDNFSGFTVAVVSGDTSLLGHLKLKAEDSKRVLIGKLQGKLVKYHIQ